MVERGGLVRPLRQLLEQPQPAEVLHTLKHSSAKTKVSSPGVASSMTLYVIRYSVTADMHDINKKKQVNI